MPTLTWLTRESDLKKAKQANFRILEKVPELSVDIPVGNNPVGTGRDLSLRENLIIQGDNLEALKALLPIYAGKVKCVFIDPPYNTRSAFEHYDDNMEHTLWLSMMVPRLELLKDLLAEDGSIWVSIDDNEAHYLKVVMDEIFGRKNFVASNVWQKIHSTKNDAKYLSENHDYILVYGKNVENLKINLLQRTEGMNSRYQNPDNDPRGDWQSGDLVANEERKNGYYEIKGPTGKIFNVPKGKHWVYAQDTMENMILDNRIWFGKDGTAFPRKKRFLSEVQQGRKGDTWWDSNEVGHNQEAKREAKSLNEVEVFSTPKPERLIQRILQLATNENDLVLDSFLGSGTTAAVAHKMGRRYIGIEIGEHAVTHIVPRLRKVIEGEQGGISEAVGWKGGGGFSFYRLGETIFNLYGAINPKIKFPALAQYIWFMETGMSLPSSSVTPLIGIHNDTAYYLLYNGILGDKSPEGGNALTRSLLAQLPPFEGKKIIFGESCRISPDKLKDLQITFKQIPYDLKVK